MTTRKKKLAFTGGILLILLAALFPLPVRDLSPEDQTYLVRQAIAAMQDPPQRVLCCTSDHWWSYRYKTLGCANFTPGRSLVLRHSFPLAEAVCREYGIRPIATGTIIDVDAGKEALLAFEKYPSENTSSKPDSEYLYFGCTYGTLGGEGYKVRVYHTLFFRFSVFALWEMS